MGSSDEEEGDGSDDLSGFITTTTGAEETPGATDRCACVYAGGGNCGRREMAGMGGEALSISSAARD